MERTREYIKKKLNNLFHRTRSLSDHAERGQALLELAVGMIILLIMLAGVIDLGRMSFYYIAMRDAAQEGAVYGSANPTHCIQIEDRAYANLVDMGTVQMNVIIRDTGTGATYPCQTALSHPETACIGNEIRVTVTDPDFPLTMPFLGTFLGSQTIPLEATVSNTILRPICVSP